MIVTLIDEAQELTHAQQLALIEEAVGDHELPELTEAEMDMLVAAMPNPPRLHLPADETPVPTHCSHGVYIAKGDSTALYCTACNPGSGRIIVPLRHVPEVKHTEHEPDVAEYMGMPLHARLTAGESFSSMEL